MVEHLAKVAAIHPPAARRASIKMLVSWRASSNLIRRLSRRFEVDRHATSTCNDYIAQNQFIHFRPEETIQCFLRLADHGLVLIKGSVEYHRYARQIAEAFDQLVISWIG